MKIIILAAGKGERLMPLTRNTPKPLLDMGNGFTLMEEQISRIKTSAVIHEIVLVTGFFADKIESKVRHLQELGIKISTIYNPFYDISNNLISLWLARHEMNGDFLITNGDNLFSPEIFSGLVNNSRNGIFLSVCKKDRFDDDDMKVKLDGEKVTRVHKSLSIAESNAESPGLVLVSGDEANKFFKTSLDQLIRHESSRHCFWLEIFNFMHGKGFDIKPFWFDARWKWQEVDFHLDMDKARELLRIK